MPWSGRGPAGGGLALGRAGSRPAEAIRTPSPVDHFGLVDLVALVLRRGEAGSGADGAVHVHHAAARAADQMVVVVADAILEARRRAGGLDAPDETFGDEKGETVVHGLERDGADLRADDLRHAIGRDVRLPRDRAQHGQSLGGDLNAASPEEFSRVGCHGALTIAQILDSFKYCDGSPCPTPSASQEGHGIAQSTRECAARFELRRELCPKTEARSAEGRAPNYDADTAEGGRGAPE